ncbi:hypothetical protein [Methylobacterium soli]|uniref:Uncharacterized protein n=1 Tax=Methylobacterium soli TaxID=553447 RepID=A0A6L3T3A4_9HYPH|nr:hypothetical protein [Methylobacterium soli]KAB1081285.1 hypothetical protein F6X53_02970 [Methylobacterium soli]GJE45589.1 hypothetical protein AEGHOMDF_4789 [Methylobacterium soli]
MIALLSALWPGLAGAFVLGLAVGGLTGFPKRRAIPLGLLGVAVLLAVMAQSGFLTGDAGLSVETAAVMLPAYLGGCLGGAFLSSLRQGSAEKSRG